MSNRDDYRGYRGDDRRDGRRDRNDARNPQGQGGWGWNRGAGGEQNRAFGPSNGPQGERGRYNSDEARYGAGPRGGHGEGEREPWRRDRYGSRFDQDRVDYGSGYDPQQGGYGAGYAGQEYGVEAGGGRDRQDPRRARDNSRETWRPGDQGAPYGDLELNARNSGVQDFGAPHDYAYHPPQGHEFEPEYVTWRDRQLAGHDRDYQEWRRHQHEQYDNDYRNFRSQKRDHFGKTFSEWRAQREEQANQGQAKGGQPSAEFGQAPAAVQAASDGDQRASAPSDSIDRTTDTDRKH